MSNAYIIQRTCCVYIICLLVLCILIFVCYFTLFLHFFLHNFVKRYILLYLVDDCHVEFNDLIENENASNMNADHRIHKMQNHRIIIGYTT